MLIFTKLIEGNYRQLPASHPCETKERVTLGREEFLHALRRAEIMTSEKQNSVKFIFTKMISPSPPTAPMSAKRARALPLITKARKWPLPLIPAT